MIHGLIRYRERRKMKKIFITLVSCTLVLATLACRLPFISSAAETDTAGESIQEEAATSIEIEEPAEAEETVSGEGTTDDVLDAESMEASSGGTKVFSDNGVEITLPDTYLLGDVETDLVILVEGLQAVSEEEDAADIETLYEKNKEDIILWAYDASSPPTHQTSLLVMKNEEFAGMSLALIATFTNVLFGSEVDSLHQETMTLGEHEVLRFLTTSENAGVVTAQAIYLFNDSGKLWMVGFFTNQEQFEDRLPTFDAAAASLNVLPQE